MADRELSEAESTCPECGLSAIEFSWREEAPVEAFGKVVRRRRRLVLWCPTSHSWEVDP